MSRKASTWADAAPSHSKPEIATKPPKHTSIVYFHGMGTPRRYEELSRVLDTLDRYSQQVNDIEELGLLRAQDMDWEPSRAAPDSLVAYIEFLRLIWTPAKPNDDKLEPRPVGSFRLYESYWSPAAAGGMSAIQVAVWVLLRIFTPFEVWRRRWRDHQRFKLSFLNRMFYDRGPMPARRFQRLHSIYRAFENMDARRRYPRGSMNDFRAFIVDNTSVEGQERSDLLSLSKTWGEEVNRSQRQVLLVGSTLLALLFGVATIGVSLMLRVLSWFDAADWAGDLAVMALAFPVAMAIVSLALTPVIWIYGRRFFRNFLADVVFWTTTFEKDVRYSKRRDILRNCEDTLRHVLADADCDRVVIVGHSLGTAIAYETLLNLGRRVTAERNRPAGGKTSVDDLGPLVKKISHIVTCGSPIDRISYFFNLAFSRYHRFNRVRDAAIGQTSDLPFQDDRERKIQWINVRDAADPIASRLFAPRGKIPNREEILEIEVSSSHIPNPAGAHVGYFDAVLSAKLLFDACILNRQQTQAQQERSTTSRRYTVWGRRTVWGCALVMAWSMGVGGAAFWGGWPVTASISQICFLAGVSLIAITLVGGVMLDRRERLTLPA